MDENDELNHILATAPPTDDVGVRMKRRFNEPSEICQSPPVEEAEDKFDTTMVQWSTSNGVIYIPTGHTVDVLKPGYYEIAAHPNIGLYFEKIPVKTDGLLEFPDANTKRVTTEIKKFWNSEDKFRERNLTYKRGIILWGPPGGGKSCTLQLVSRDVIERGGIVIKFTAPGYFSAGIRKLREIQPETPVVVLMEDIDSTIVHYSETEVINILDGVDRMDKIVFLATTNYPEKLGQRIMNRPSRFDKRYKVGYPNAASRKLYLEYLLGDKPLEVVDVDKWVEDTQDFSIAHLKELFVAVVVFEDTYDEALKTLKTMKTEVTSWGEEEKQRMGLRDSREAVADFIRENRRD
jgi:DNA replication protein DnaC